MATFRNPEQLRKAQLARFAKAKRSVQLSHDQAVRQEISEKADKLMSGTIPKAWIQRHHPYARRNGVPLAPRLPLNRHTGRLKNSKRLVRISGGWRLQYTAPYSKFILRPGGTKFALARGFYTELNKSNKRISERVRKALLAAHR